MPSTGELPIAAAKAEAAKVMVVGCWGVVAVVGELMNFVRRT